MENTDIESKCFDGLPKSVVIRRKKRLKNMKNKKEKSEGYKAVGDALSKLIDEHGQDETLHAMSDIMVDIMGLDVLTMVIESIKEKEKKRYAEMRSKIAWEIQHKKDVKDGKFRKQLIHGSKERKQLMDRGR